MYLLTDYSEEELKLLNEILETELEQLGWDLKSPFEHKVLKAKKRVSLVREMNVRALTALQIVRDRNLIAQS